MTNVNTPIKADSVYMQNRELSWLKFNKRVLHQAFIARTPLLERLKFLSIFTSNLDEFFMIRVGTLFDYLHIHNDYRENKTGMNARQQLNEIFSETAELYIERTRAYDALSDELTEQGIRIVHVQELEKDEQREILRDFQRDILPLLSPQIVDSSHPFPHLANKKLYIAVALETKKGRVYGLIPVPDGVPRLFPVGTGGRFALVEDVLCYYAQKVFPIYNISEKNIVAVTRNADISIERELFDEGVDFRQHMSKLLKKRLRLAPVRLELERPSSTEFTRFFCDKLEIKKEQVFISKAPLDLSFYSDLDAFYDRELISRLSYPPHTPYNRWRSLGHVDMADEVARRDLLLSFPFESMAPLLTLLWQAADDESVVSIKITLYRIDNQSQLAEALIRAAEGGREVVVLLELRARFDENNNIKWAHRLEESGCNVIYGFPDYKVHSKICLITRRQGGRTNYITHIGTGNYNEKTARQYTDVSVVTDDAEIGSDASRFFVDMLIGNLDGEYAALWVAPRNFKLNFLRALGQEQQKAISGRIGRVIIKCNSLTDREIIENLVKASQAGVKISMIVRGICCLTPGVPGYTENISVVSIVGRFLEHSRIFCFGEGSEREVYISSADLMTRNTERRVEIACPVRDRKIQDEICVMLDTLLRDNIEAWEQSSDGLYTLRKPNGAAAFASQANLTEYFAREQNTSLHAKQSASQRREVSAAQSAISKRKLGLIDLFRAFADAISARLRRRGE